MADVFFDLDPENIGAIAVVALEVVEQASRDVAGKQFRSGVLDGQQHAVGAREI